MIDKVHAIGPILGCDPEFFFRLDGQIIGAEKLLPKHGLKAGGGNSKFIIDGVQAELNPSPSTCREILAGEIAICFRRLDAEMKAKGKAFTCDFSRTVEISKEALAELAEESRKFGCAPSNSIYTKKAALKLSKIDPSAYRIRAAGGHIHIGANHYAGLTRALTKDHARTVEMLDILCGNTAVLVDRDKGNVERRKLYGKAGEFRLPAHGLEYRTLSNFWLQHYTLLSFAFGMARFAVMLMSDDRNHDLYYKEFTSKVKSINIHKAINKNDFKLAMKNFRAIEQLISDVAVDTGFFALHSKNIADFHHFINVIEDKGIGYWFPQDPMTHWVGYKAGAHRGFSDYLMRDVREDRIKKQRKAA